MARSNLSDVLSAFPFWLMDIAPSDPLALPVLLPSFGFSEITAPEYVGETYDVVEGNNLFTQKVLRRTSVPNITLQRGATWYDSDFYRWMLACITGNTGGSQINGIPLLNIGGATYRRNMVLVQYFSTYSFGSIASSVAASSALAGVGVMVSGGSVSDALGEVAKQAVTETAVALIGDALGFGPTVTTTRIPARAWVLQGVIPVRYKVGSDFNASSSALSFMELELSVDLFDEISLAG